MPINSLVCNQTSKDLISFYKYINGISFDNLSSQRASELDHQVDKWRYYFNQRSSSQRTLMYTAAEKLRVSHKWLGAIDKVEAAYFFVKLVDPDFLFLEASEAACTIQQKNRYMMDNFNIYDPYLPRIEALINKRFNFYDINDIWALDRIKKNIDKNVSLR